MLVPWAAHTVEHHATPGQPGILLAKARHQRPDGGSLAAGVHNKQQGQVQQAGHVGGAALLAGAEAVIQAHDPLHQAGIRGAPPVVERRP